MSKYNKYLGVPLTNEQEKILEVTIDDYRSKYSKRIGKAEAIRILAFGNGDAKHLNKNVSPPSNDTFPDKSNENESKDSEHQGDNYFKDINLEV